MSRAYREHLERLYPALRQFADDDCGQDRAQADQGMEQWYADRDAQDEYASWLQTLEEIARE